MARAYVIAFCEEVRHLLRDVLNRRGVTAEVFRQGDEAIDHLRSHPERPDALVVGCVPPLIGGQMELLGELSRLDPSVLSRTILLTDAVDISAIASEARRLGVPVVLPMPFDLDDLARGLDGVVGGRGGAG